MKIHKIVNLSLFINQLIIIILMARKLIEEINAYARSRRNLKIKELYCNYCGEQLQSDENYFIDILGFTFCNRECYSKAKKIRQPKINILQKQFDVYSPRTQIYDDSYRYLHLR